MPNGSKYANFMSIIRRTDGATRFFRLWPPDGSDYDVDDNVDDDNDGFYYYEPSNWFSFVSLGLIWFLLGICWTCSNV